MKEHRESPGGDELSDGVFLIIALLGNLVPSLAFLIAPGGEVGDKQEVFLTIYLTTLPLSLALTGIAFIWFRGLFESDRERALASAAIMLVSGFVGLNFGASQADQELLSKVHGPPYFVIPVCAVYILLSYAIYYGAALFFSAFLVSLVVGLWLHEKLPD
jgi:hypothetical protein